MYNLLIVLPVLFTLLVLINYSKFKNIITIGYVAVLMIISLYGVYIFESEIRMSFSHTFHTIFIFVDILLILYFFYQGFINQHRLVGFFAFIQLLLYGFVLSLESQINAADILIDEISIVMYMIINIVGGVIIVYALKYIENEDVSTFKKRFFIALLFFFLGVMNFLVSTNNIEIFFMLFELTTLCSYLLIGFRKDKVALKNSLLALWINQIGGVAILLVLVLSKIEYDTLYFDILLASIEKEYLLVIALLAFTALIKGATIPFQNWLLGAMVAPTPVSAMLHSATMVKIAPYLILKITPAMGGFLSLSFTILGTFVFMAASMLALSKDYFKEILGLSTIALLALMMALASIGTTEAINAALVLMVFHAISKALLFLQAGILEKSFHLKYMKDIEGLINHSHVVVAFIVIGFASLTLPPFGAFIAKFMAIESVANMINTNPLYIVALVFIALGSVFLTLLYFKVLTKLFAVDVDSKDTKEVSISKYYTLPSYTLVALLIIGIFVSYKMELLSLVQLSIPVVLLLVTALLLKFTIFTNAHRVKEYHCGEKDRVELNMYYFKPFKETTKIVSLIAFGLIVLMFIGVLL